MFLSTSTLLLALSAAVSAVPLTSLTSHNVELDRRATFKNQQNAIDIARRATILPAGSYTFKAVTSGNWVTYRNKNGQSFFPDTEATYGSPISFEGNADGLAPNSTRFMPTLSNYKCGAFRVPLLIRRV